MNPAVSDILCFIGTLTVRKVLNYIRLKLSFGLSFLLKKNFHSGKPCALSIEPTSKCNLHCAECPTGNGTLKRHQGAIKEADFLKIVDHSYSYLLSLNIYFQGEPFLHRNIYDFISYCYSKKIYSIISSNGHFLDIESCEKIVSSKLSRIIISLDGASQKSYEKYRIGGDFNKVVHGIENLVRAKRKFNSARPFIIVQFLVNSSNEDEIKDAKMLTKNLGADKFEIKFMQISKLNPDNALLPKNKMYSRYNIENNKIVSKSQYYTHCFRSWSSCVITWDGKLLPCCYDKDAEHSFGNAFENGANEIFAGKDFNKFRSKLICRNGHFQMCENCIG